MTHPIRIQLSRRKGFDLQTASMAASGLPAVNVARPSRWGNPFVVGKDGDAATCMAMYREHALDVPSWRFVGQTRSDDAREDLRDKNLACWCKPGDPCHADVLLELANR